MPTTVTVIGVPTGPFAGLILTVRSSRKPPFADLLPVHHGEDVVQAAEVLRHLERHLERAARVGGRVRERDADLVDLAPDVVEAVGLRVEDVADVRRHPDEADGLGGREPRPRERHARARRRHVGRRLERDHLVGRRAGVDHGPEELGCPRDRRCGDRHGCRDSAGLQERERTHGDRAAEGEHLPSVSSNCCACGSSPSFRLVVRGGRLRAALDRRGLLRRRRLLGRGLQLRDDRELVLVGAERVVLGLEDDLRGGLAERVVRREDPRGRPEPDPVGRRPVRAPVQLEVRRAREPSRTRT